MTPRDLLTEQFEASRPRLRSLAYRMLGSPGEADDAVQETWIRLDRSGSGGIDNLAGWLTTVVARVCLDRLRSRGAHREDPAADLVEDSMDLDDEHDPEQHAVMADSVGAALLVVLELLGPTERVAFVLHDVFAVPFEEIGEILDRSPDAARQLASRARRRVQGAPVTPAVDLVRQREVVAAFIAAARLGDFDALLNLLHPAVALRPDATVIQSGALRPLRGAGEVLAAMSGGAKGAVLALVDGVPGVAWRPRGRTRGAAAFTVSDGRITAIDVIGDPARLEELDIVLIGSD